MSIPVAAVGRLTRDAEILSLNNGASIVKFTIATDRPYKTDDADFFDVECYVAETDETQLDKRVPNLTKGLKVTLLPSDARLEIQKWEDADGNPRSKPVIKIRNTWSIEYDSKAVTAGSGDPGDDIPFD